jgi:hypothetical protein
MLLATVALVAGALAAHRAIAEAPARAEPPLQFANSTAAAAAPFPSR